jgi:anthranilate phosphoribosyltransferase
MKTDDVLHSLRARQDLSPEMAQALFAQILDGRLNAEEISYSLIALADRGESEREIAAAVAAMRARMIKANVRSDAIDVCGTGGDGAHTLNISTAVALVVAAAGVPVAKHGNKAASSSSGASDVLTALGVNIAAPQAVVERCVNELGIGYFAAPLYHPALAALAPIRKAIGRRTIFNLLGPMCNPASVSRQMVGIAAADKMRLYADVLLSLGSERLVIVHGDGGLDELSPSGSNTLMYAGRDADSGAAVVSDSVELAPEDFGLKRAPLAALRGGTPAQNALALRHLLHGARGAYRDTVLMNAAIALGLADNDQDEESQGLSLSDALARAAEAIDSHRALALLECWTTMSHQS